MKALMLKEYMNLQIVDLPKPVLLSPDEICIRIKASAICGSDIHGFDGSTGRRKPPLIMGHEASGEIEAIGSAVMHFKVGDRVTFDSTVWCGECYFCRRGEVNLCENRRVLGVSCEEYRKDGAFAEYLVVPERIVFKIPDEVSFESASLTEPVSVAMHAFRITPTNPGEHAVVVGSGLIGLLLIQILRAYSPHLIIALDTDESRRSEALKAGANVAFDPRDPRAILNILELTNGRGVDRAFEAVGASSSIETAILSTRKGGSVTLIGNISPKAEIPLQSVVTREISIRGSCAISGEYPISLELMAQGRINPSQVISKVAPLEEGPELMRRLYQRDPALLKVVLTP